MPKLKPFIPPPGTGPITDETNFVNNTWLNFFQSVFFFLKRAPTVSTGIIAPTSAPDKIGDLYFDVVAKKVYAAMGTDSSADWEILN